MQQVLPQTDVPVALRELKQLRNEKPRISPIVFSPDFEALYTLPSKAPADRQAIKHLVGHGLSWYFDTEIATE
jgi:hypothetical protein